MCELFALSSRLPTVVDMSLEEFSRHGGLTGPHKDGWGIAYYDGLDVRLIRDTTAAADSDWVRFLAHHPLHSSMVVSHIRRATLGKTLLSNTQPTLRELGGRMHVFAHNGHMEGIWNQPGLRLGFHRPVGTTDSEYAFCALLARLEELWRDSSPPTAADRISAVGEFARALRPLGPANFLYSDGELLIAHGHRRTQSDGGIRPPGMWTLQRQCPATGEGFNAEGLSVSPEGQRVVLLASVPLTEEEWRPLDEGEIVAISAAQHVVSPPAPSPRT